MRVTLVRAVAVTGRARTHVAEDSLQESRLQAHPLCTRRSAHRMGLEGPRCPLIRPIVPARADSSAARQ